MHLSVRGVTRHIGRCCRNQYLFLTLVPGFLDMGPYPALFSIRRRSTTVWVSMSLCAGDVKTIPEPTVTATMPWRSTTQPIAFSKDPRHATVGC